MWLGVGAFPWRSYQVTAYLAAKISATAHWVSLYQSVELPHLPALLADAEESPAPAVALHLLVRKDHPVRPFRQQKKLKATLDDVLRYWLFGEWIPPLCRTIRDVTLGIYHWFLDSIVSPTVCFLSQNMKGKTPHLFSAQVRMLKALWAGITYVVLLKWVPPLLRWIRDTFLGNFAPI